MDNFVQAADINIMSFSDDDDLRLFESSRDPELATKILRVKHNDPDATSLELTAVDLNEVASRRLGYILGINTHVKSLVLIRCNLDVVGLCVGLQNNQCIEKLWLVGIDFRDTDKLNSLALILGGNPSLKDITLQTCSLGPVSINILSNAFSNCSEDTLEFLSLSGNHFSDVDLDELIRALSRNRRLWWLQLSDCEIGQRGCASLASLSLLENQESSLQYLHLHRNSIDDESAIVLAASLAKNNKLTWLSLRGNNGIITPGWLAMLKLVCNNTSINGVLESNHELDHLGYSSSCILNAVNGALGIDNANLLCASLKMNRIRNKRLVVRRKVLWSHARGNLNIGDSSIVTAAMPRILAWIGDDSNETNANLIQSHDPPLPKARVDMIRFDSIYRILRSRPNLCNSEQNIPNDPETCQKELVHHRTDAKRKADEMQSKRRNLNDTKTYTKETWDLADEKKELVSKKLDDDMDDYWAKKGGEGGDMRLTPISSSPTTPLFPKRGLIQSDLIRSTVFFGPDLIYATVNKTYRMILRNAERSWYITEWMRNARRIRCSPKQSNLNDTKTHPKET
eukprot:CAMPEP_0201948784 /NCGR_PEP_ID=MMETSP0903-20130614/55637_1 /ASSEMBLY_ACC=CAM_ASM_000552 /TAXON_ID=420261 /ORGANISM="Thalassiosira antarctica, Strain CCMP982" /LENGTH=568 /DNA_ID=CAMNT_0048491979 /DNA_START=72 /DNA_END=1779 /DNA_ORIENTATION=+